MATTDKNKEKAGKSAAKKATAQKPNRIQKWWNQTVGELRRVTWPTREEAIRMTKIVLVVVVAMAVFLGVIDFIFSELFGFIIG